jgi:hypothetical protein
MKNLWALAIIFVAYSLAVIAVMWLFENWGFWRKKAAAGCGRKVGFMSLHFICGQEMGDGQIMLCCLCDKKQNFVFSEEDKKALRSKWRHK